jgi:hypothetical protein
MKPKRLNPKAKVQTDKVLERNKTSISSAPENVVSGRILWRTKRAQQARDRNFAVRGEASEDRLLISPKDARSARIEWPDVDLDD